MAEPSEARVPDAPAVAPPRSRWPHVWARIQFALSVVAVSGMLAYLLWAPETGPPATAGQSQSDRGGDVRVVGSQLLRVRPDSPLSRKLRVTTVQAAQITAPVLTVPGTVVASLRPGNGKGNDYWQFNAPELLTAFTDWQKATADISFTETQLTQIRQLGETRVSAQQKLVERMKKLVAAGTDTEKDLAAAQTDLIQSQIQGRKEVHDAETAVRLARRTEAAASRQLQQAGLDPGLLHSMTWDVDIVMADVPEGMVARVKLAQACTARFSSFPDQTFPGKVRAISPVLSKERRSLRVLFEINDPRDQLRPGMFADIGLGTDARQALLASPEAIVHVGHSDYVLVRRSSEDWRVTEVQVGELHDGSVEILGGLRAADQVAAQGVILLKPYMIQALQTHGPAREGRS